MVTNEKARFTSGFFLPNLALSVIKQVHSRSHIIILIKTKELRQHFIKSICKQINTTNGIANLHT
ncbi:hypothetical protein ACTJKU_26010, partial [Citrobacter freundii]